MFILRQVQNFYPKSLNEGVVLDQNSRLVCELIGARFCIRNYLFFVSVYGKESSLKSIYRIYTIYTICF